MIQSAEKNEKQFLQALRESPVMGVRIETLYACYKNYPSLCAFYLAGANAALSVTGSAALITGRPEDAEELAELLNYLGIQEIEGIGLTLPGFEEEPFEVLSYKPSAELIMGVFEIEKEPSPATVWEILHKVGAQMTKDSFYADYCMRYNKGLAQVYTLKENGKSAATAGVYSMNETEAYISYVATLPEYRRKGYATAVCHSLASNLGNRNIYVACEASISRVYEKAGFYPNTQMVRLTRKEAR